MNPCYSRGSLLADRSFEGVCLMSLAQLIESPTTVARPTPKPSLSWEELKQRERTRLEQQSERQYGPAQSIAPLNVECGGFGGI
jgi:hypothetical protein